MRSTLLAALATIGLVGCVGGIESGGGGDPLESPDGDGNDNGDNPSGSDLTAAKQLFDTNVFPVIQRCSGGACHSETATGATLTRFVATDAARGWQTATNYTAFVGNFTATAAPVLTYIQGKNHQGLADWSSDEVSKITQWLDKELELRNGQTTPPPAGEETLAQASERVLSQFAGCMTLENFKTANMTAWGNVGSGEGPCRQCHVTGGEGFIASNQAEPLFYQTISTRKYFFLQYFTVELINGAASAKVILNRTSFRGVALGQDPHREHPRFNLDNNGMTASQNFYNLTMEAIAAGGCAPRPFTN